ncbi:hypothetical protein IEQ34_011427 [Dendrobium chrysotoxum]|uniref:Uncharacterized protein n=1 Tax=Dendrobium chrysotoxum TaxID=161865 RepID=A0AAV7GSL4_DENCH|nr:hypothetical protein IEQ34_011427 [Dendrobium chrysotoxum]
MEISRWIKPETELHLSISFSLGEECISYIVGSDSAGRVAGNEFDLHIYLAEEVLMPRLEAGARRLVKRKSE